MRYIARDAGTSALCRFRSVGAHGTGRTINGIQTADFMKTRKAFIQLVIPVASLAVIAGWGFALLIRDLWGGPTEAGSYLQLISGTLSTIALYLAFERILTVYRLDRIEASGVSEGLIGLSRKAHARLISAINSYVMIYDIWKLGKTSRWSKSRGTNVIEAFTDDHFLLIESLAEGKIRVPFAQSFYAHDVLLNYYHSSYSAVSGNGVGFWLNRESSDYHEIIRRSVKRGNVINRIFLLSRRELEAHSDQIDAILSHQSLAGMGWGIAITEELDLKPALKGLRKDFALLNRDEAVTFFQVAQGEKQIFEAMLHTDANRTKLARYRELYDELIGECWIVNKEFRSHAEETLTGEAKRRAVRKALASNAEVIRAGGPQAEDGEASFFLLASAAEIRPKLDLLLEAFAKLDRLRKLEHARV